MRIKEPNSINEMKVLLAEMCEIDIEDIVVEDLFTDDHGERHYSVKIYHHDKRSVNRSK